MNEAKRFSVLKDKQRKLRDGFHENLGLRVHRALSWLNLAEKSAEDENFDAAFIFLWISFNAIYAQERIYRDGISEKDLFSDFFCKILDMDKGGTIFNAVWTQFSGPIRNLMVNKFVYRRFWESVNNPSKEWKLPFEHSSARFKRAFQRKDTARVLSFLFDRLYVLRNQLIHGGSTWNGKTNRTQVRDGARILGFLMPHFIDLMMDNPQVEWERPFYPVIED